MPHVLEPAASGRAKCRGCARAIPKGQLRFGERLPNPFADESELTLWFHLACAAYKRPAPLLEALAAHDGPVPERPWLDEQAQLGLAHRRLPRLDGAERAPSGRAKCRACREPISKGSWRLRLVYFDQGRFDPGGCVHAACARAYFDGADAATVRARATHFAALDAADGAALEAALG